VAAENADERFLHGVLGHMTASTKMPARHGNRRLVVATHERVERNCVRRLAKAPHERFICQGFGGHDGL
jgi:hypothetical protein